MVLVTVLACAHAHAWQPSEDALERMGLSPSDYTIGASWAERTLVQDQAEYVYGYRLLATDGSGELEVYTDSDGTRLSAEEVAALGVRMKRWNDGPISVPAETSVGFKSTQTSLAAPRGPAKGAVAEDGVIVPLIDLAAIQLEDYEDQQIGTKGGVRTGVVQDLEKAIQVNGVETSVGEWHYLPDGTALWSAFVWAPDAVGQRIHFDGVNVPFSTELIVYDADNPGNAFGPYPREVQGREKFWSASCFSDMVVVECIVPADEVENVAFSIDQIVYIYRDLLEKDGEKGAGNCNLDVSCYPDWTVTSVGVGAVGSIQSGGFLFCTGSLIADTDPDTNAPYFLTANHCVGSQSGANDVEVYWIYQTDSCNGTPPSQQDSPVSTGGATLVANGSEANSTDFALLRLRGTVPDGLTYLGWSTAVWPAGTEVSCVHHPRGDFKRIAFGDTINDGPLQPTTRFHGARWTEGTTEPGSSGSPLLLEDTQQIIGQLWGGTASCSNLNGPDYYGRFDVTFPIIQHILEVFDGPEDIDKSGVVNSIDIQIVVNAIINGDDTFDADVNGDDAVNIVDLFQVIFVVLNQ
jgi:hypothetical protein